MYFEEQPCAIEYEHHLLEVRVGAFEPVYWRRYYSGSASSVFQNSIHLLCANRYIFHPSQAFLSFKLRHIHLLTISTHSSLLIYTGSIPSSSISAMDNAKIAAVDTMSQQVPGFAGPQVRQQL